MEIKGKSFFLIYELKFTVWSKDIVRLYYLCFDNNFCCRVIIRIFIYSMGLKVILTTVLSYLGYCFLIYTVKVNVGLVYMSIF